MKNLNDLAKQVTLKEGKKKSISIAQVKEVIGLISEAIHEKPEIIAELIKLGAKRKKKETSSEPASFDQDACG